MNSAICLCLVKRRHLTDCYSTDIQTIKWCTNETNRVNKHMKNFSAVNVCGRLASHTEQKMTKQRTVLSHELWTVITHVSQSLHTTSVSALFYWLQYTKHSTVNSAQLCICTTATNQWKEAKTASTKYSMTNRHKSEYDEVWWMSSHQQPIAINFCYYR